MRRLILTLGILVLIFNLSAQNGFLNTDLDISVNAYSIDFEGNYWFTDSEKIYKYDGSIISTYDTDNTNLEFNMVKNIWPYQEYLYVVTGTNVWGFNQQIPNNSYDLGLDKTIVNTFFDGEDLAVVSVVEIGILGLEIFDGSVWSELDTLPEFANVQSMAFYQGSLYLSLKNIGVYKYHNQQFEPIIDRTIYDMIIWDGKLWMTDGFSFGIWEEESYNEWIAQASVSGARHFQIINDELWAGSFDKLYCIHYDHIDVYETNDDVQVFPNFGSTTDVVQYVYNDQLVTFDQSQYISDPEFSSLENMMFTTINNVEAMFSVFGSFFWDLQGTAHFYVPNTDNVSSLFAGALWMAGKDGSNKVHAAYERYLTDGIRFTPGPLNEELETSDQVRNAYNKIWHIDRATLENFKYRYEIGDISNGYWPIDHFIESWPAHGPAGYAENLAPFIDVNNDGTYNPMDGDYPEMKGDEMLYWIVNDNNHNNDTYDDSRNLGVEVHYTVWANRYENPETGNLDYYNDTSELVNNTIFMDVDIINRSSSIYHDFYVGFWTDGDLGFSDDDFIGMDVMNHAVYYFNGDPYDNPTANPPGYGADPPAQSLMFLKAPLKNSLPTIDTGCYISKFVSFDRSTSINGSPDTLGDFYNYLRGKWKDGSNVTWGGFGIDSSEVVADYMYPGSSDIHNIGTGGVDMGEWSEYSASHLPADKRGVASNGPLVFFSGDTLSFRFAFSFVRDENSDFPYSVGKLQEMMPIIHEWQRTGEFPSNYHIEMVSAGINLNTNSNWEIDIYPNPTEDFIIVNSQKSNFNYRIINLGGQELLNGKVIGNRKKIDLKSIPNGMYIISLNNNKEMVSKKIIIQ